MRCPGGALTGDRDEGGTHEGSFFESKSRALDAHDLPGDVAMGLVGFDGGDGLMMARIHGLPDLADELDLLGTQEGEELGPNRLEPLLPALIDLALQAPVDGVEDVAKAGDEPQALLSPCTIDGLGGLALHALEVSRELLDMTAEPRESLGIGVAATLPAGALGEGFSELCSDGLGLGCPPLEGLMVGLGVLTFRKQAVVLSAQLLDLGDEPTALLGPLLSDP